MEAAARAALNEAATGISRANFNVKGGLTFAGVNGEPERSLRHAEEQLHAARRASPIQLDDKTVVRGGYGMFYGFLGQRRGDVIRSGFSQATPLNVSLDNGLTFIETLSNPFQGGILEPVGAARRHRDVSRRGRHRISIPSPKSPRMQRWQIGLQRELGRNWVAEIRYVGNFGSQILTTRNLNALPERVPEHEPDARPTRRSTSSARHGAEPVRRPDAGDRRRRRGVRPPSRGERLLRPYPHFDAVNTTTNEGESWYNAVQMRARSPLRQRLHPRRQLHLLAVRRGHRVPEPARSGTVEGDLGRRHAAPALGQRARRTAIRPGTAVRERTHPACARHPDRRLAVRRDLLVPERHPARRGATSCSRATSTTSTCRAASGPSLRWFNTDAGFNKVTDAAARLERPHLPAPARQRAQAGNQQRRPVASSRTRRSAGRRCSSGWRR